MNLVSTDPIAPSAQYECQVNKRARTAQGKESPTSHSKKIKSESGFSEM